NGGHRTPPPRAVRSPQLSGGAAGGDDEPGQIVMTPAEDYFMTSLLEGGINAGPRAAARALRVPRPRRGKKGATEEGARPRCVGGTPGLLVAVWVGYDSGEPHGLSGAEGALPIWAEFIRPAMDSVAARPSFTVPPGVSFVEIDLTNGKTANRFCPRTGKEVFL